MSTPLELRPVKSIQPGVCHAGTSNTIEDSSFSDCLVVGPSGLTVRRLKAVSYQLPSDDSPIIDLTFNAADGRTVAELTTRLAGLSAPRNDLAIMIGDPSNGQLIAAPAVMSAVKGDSIQLILAGFDEARARKVADQLAGH
ncbi:hypothetical protein GCM10011575_40180 [Microlunatus endophyticus]|uniref:SecDF P1 head subdomain domain-containing protein n=1 Tax=Microlunatus endophyticus TaxID=1716077 RepID=A0A917W8P8_9ACTN|nr:hypothetical protein GCM10011575_40180 [Microlunatus endophyticus]